MNATGQARVTFVSAGAGSGKTHRLTALLHEALAGGAVRPSGVIATTFTRRAAAELRERVRGHLLARGAFGLANAIGQARIGTVNAVCGELIERFAFEAGMATGQQVLEDAQAEVLLGKAVDAVLDGPAMGALLDVARRLGLDRDAQGRTEPWKEALKALADQVRANDIDSAHLPAFARRNADDLLDHFPPPAAEDLTAQLRQAIAGVLPQFAIAAATGGKKNTNDYLALLRAVARDLDNGSAAWGGWVKLAKAQPEAKLKPLAEPIAALAGRVAEHPGLHADIREYLERIFALCADALQAYAKAKRELGALDFTDQEHLLLGLLDHPAVAAVLAEELDLLLVDEFQDTSPLQLALFLKLAGFAKTVYWVGDVKQAIYGFRGSDTALMQAVLAALPAMGGAKQILDTSWRSRRQLVWLANAVFGHAFAGSLAREEVELTPQRDEVLPDPPLAQWLLGGRNQDEEAAALARGIGKLVASNHRVLNKGQAQPRAVRRGDIAVLSRTNEGVQRIAAALRAHGIPAATAQPGLLATPEATLALACLRRLVDPGDTVATAEILSLADCAEPEEWVADRLRWLAAGGDAQGWMEQANSERPAHPVIAILARLRRELPLLAPREALHTVIAASDLPNRVVRWTPDAQRARVRLANLEALLELAAQYETLCESGRHAGSVSGLIVWLGELAADGQDMLAEPAVDAVKVMTHHAAKGLEWPLVVLTDLSADIRDRLWSVSAQSDAAFDAQAPLAQRFVRYWPWPFGAQKKVGVADAIALTPLARRFRQAAVEEEKRLLYVSMTRARDLLVLARSARNPAGEWIDCLDAPWLAPREGDQVIALPDGKTIAASVWTLDPAGEPAAPHENPETPLRWFPAPAGATPRLPLFFLPSAADEVRCEILERVRIGERIPVAADADMEALGDAIHACLAASFTDPRAPLGVAEVERILAGFGAAELAPAAAVLRQVAALHEWIAGHWGEVRAWAEVPVQSALESGQVLNGRIDLLIDTPAGWVLVDHKSSPLGAEHWDGLAQEHAAQLRAYAGAIERASGRGVAESWLYLPVAAGGVQLAWGA